MMLGPVWDGEEVGSTEEGAQSKWQEFKRRAERCDVHLYDSSLRFYHEKITRNLAANWGRILQPLLFLTNKLLHK